MGFFSWKTSDTDRSIPSHYSNRETFTVHMITEDGQVFTETNYGGYGVFGGKDFYELVAELNGVTGNTIDKSRSNAIDICFEDNPSGDHYEGLKLPKLVEQLPSKETWKEDWDDLTHSPSCEFQGYFYESDEDEDEDNWCSDEDEDY